VELQKKRDRVEMLLGAHTSTVALPYVNTMLRRCGSKASPLQPPNDPKAIALRASFPGAGPERRFGRALQRR